MLGEHVPATRAQDTTDLGQHAHRVVHGAEHKTADDGVGTVVGQWDALGVCPQNGHPVPTG
jgi:hypothetical protein